MISQIGVYRFIVRTTRYVILSGVRSTKSKNLRILITFAVKLVRRSFDSLTLAQDDMLRQLLDKLKFDFPMEEKPWHLMLFSCRR